MDPSARPLHRLQHARILAGLARIAERGLFDGIFLADIVGVYDVYSDGPAPSIVDAVQIPVNDPMMLVPAMAAVTSISASASPPT